MKSSKILVALIVMICSFTTGISQVTLPEIIRDSMVLQRNATITIWGWASANEQITATFNGKHRKATANPQGDWSVEFPKMKAGGPYTLKISGKNDIVLEDILIGDVWLCSGQSNMVHQMNIHDVTYAEDIANANYPEIRHFKVPRKTDLTGPSKHLNGGSWEVAVSDQVRPFSAVAYFFARKLYNKYGVPIGLINASVGGTPIESWINEKGYQGFEDKLKIIEENKDTAFVNSHSRRGFSNNQAAQKPKDKGLIGEIPWYDVNFEPKNWRRINIPGYWEDQGARELNGVVWYRKEIALPQTMDSKEATVFLGRIVDADELYINGEKVGNTTYQYPQRRYDVPANILKAGKNTFVIRVTNNYGKGGFVPDKPYYIFTDKDTVDLKGYWEYKVGEVYPPVDFSSFSNNDDKPKERTINPQNEPTALYNGMVAPYTQLPIKGVLWYQGESNAGRPEEYLDLMHALIKGWRGVYKNPELPFIYAQLPNFGDVTYSPTESNWARLREAQLMALGDSNTAMTVNIDLGEWNDIHPDNKKDVGERMALAAQNIVYGEDVVYSGPLYKSAQVEDDKIIVSFSHIGGGLITDDGEALDSFEIAGEDKSFVWAKAKIEGDKVFVWSDDIPNPKFVRYAWADNPDNPNLYNKEGLPASPFSTE